MRFFDLPDVLIDYIYSFDDNVFFYCEYRKSMKQIQSIYNRRLTNIYFSNFYSFYSIYKNYCPSYILPKMNIAQYILHSNRQFGVQVILDGLDTKEIKRVNNIIVE
jgi:hypothetical protein